MTTHLPHLTHSPSRSSRRGRPILGGALAATAAALVAKAAAAAAGIRLTVRSGGGVREVGWLSVALVAFLVAAAGLALLRALSRRAHGRAVWACVAGLVLLVSLTGPLGATTLAAGLALAGLHLVVAAVVAATAHRVRHWWA